MRNALIIPFSQNEELVITTDNSGAIGAKEADVVQVPYEVVSYYSFRVAMMELLAAKSHPTSIILQNFCGDAAWNELVSGIQKGLNELEIGSIPITGSTESNFELSQSAIGVTIIGNRKKNREDESRKDQQSIALIGLPLVGNEVMEQRESVVPLSLVKVISTIENVRLWPVGSKGVLHELKRMVPNLDRNLVHSDIDLQKSGGPSTSMLVQYPSEIEGKLVEYAGNYFHRL